MIGFRSSTIRDGMFSRTGQCHLHVDGGGYQAAAEIAELLDRTHGIPCKASPVVSLANGPQRKDSPESYAEHHPAHDEDPEADSFASGFLGGVDRVPAAEEILHTIYGAHPLAVVELEQVVFDIDWDGNVSTIGEEAESVAFPSSPAFAVKPYVSYEYHHGFNVPKTAKQPELPELTQGFIDREILFGSIYVFDRGEAFAYRTNCFIEAGNPEKLIKEREMCKEIVAETSGEPVPVKTVLEKVLGIWQPAK